MRSLVAIIELSFSISDWIRCSSAFFLGMSCLLVCHPHLSSITLLTAVWARPCGLENEKTFVIIVRRWSIGIHDRSLSVLACWLEQFHGAATSGMDCLDPLISNRCWFVCVGEPATVSRYCHCGARVRDGRSTRQHSGHWQVAQSCSYFTVANVHLNNECARRRSVCIALLLLIRDLCLKPGAEVLIGDFNNAVERETPSGDFGERRISPFEAAFSNVNIPWPTSGVTPLRGPGCEPTAKNDLIATTLRFFPSRSLNGFSCGMVPSMSSQQILG